MFKSDDERLAKRIKDDHKDDLIKKKNVVGVGVGYKEKGGSRTNQPCITVLVERKVGESELSAIDLIPSLVDGVLTDVIEVGKIEAQQARTDRWRPVPGGVSIGHPNVTAGTLGTVVRDAETGERMILSNNHVMANSNNAAFGDSILQPGVHDGGQEGPDTIAFLTAFVPINFGGVNFVDAAVASPIASEPPPEEPPTCSIANAAVLVLNIAAALVGSSHRLKAIRQGEQAEGDVLADNILEIGVVSGVAEAFLGMQVRKSGRTTELTTGEVRVMDALVLVNYGDEGVAAFDRQIITSPMSAGGDSGSLLVTADGLQGVGLLFAGSTASTIHNPIQTVLDALAVTL